MTSITAPSKASFISDSKWLTRVGTAARLLLGALLVFSVANFLFSFVAQPPLPAGAMAFMGGLASSGYFFGLLKTTELLVALALLSNRFVPLALVILAPITINIVLFHLVLAPEGAAIAIVLLALHLTTAWSRRQNFREVLAAK